MNNNSFWDFMANAFGFFTDVLKAIKDNHVLAILWGFEVLILVFTVIILILGDLSENGRLVMVVLNVVILAGVFVFTLLKIDGTNGTKPAVIKGNVYFEGKIPVIGARVTIDGINDDDITNDKGFYSIDVNKQANWTVRAWYKDQGIEVTGSKTVSKNDIRQPIILTLKMPDNKDNKYEYRQEVELRLHELKGVLDAIEKDPKVSRQPSLLIGGGFSASSPPELKDLDLSNLIINGWDIDTFLELESHINNMRLIAESDRKDKAKVKQAKESLLYIVQRLEYDEKLKLARLHIKNRLEKRKGKRASFEAIREEVNKEYTDDFLKELINKNPAIFRAVKVKRGEQFRDGITLVMEEKLDNQLLDD